MTRCKLLESLVQCLPSTFVCFQANGDSKHSGKVALGSPRDKFATNPSPPVNVAVCIHIEMSHPAAATPANATEVQGEDGFWAFSLWSVSV